MKSRFIFIVLISISILISCSTGQDKPDISSIQEEYSLEWKDGQLWQIHHDSEYYAFFNKIHQEYHDLIQAANDPEEIRRLYIERDLKIAQNRLNYLADEKLVKSTVRATSPAKGANPSGHLFRMQDVVHVPMQHFTPRHPEDYIYKELNAGIFGTKTSDAITAIIQFDRQLKRRGVKLIVVPAPNSTQVYAHQLNAGIKLEESVWHPWAYMIVRLLENDVEVLDLLDLYKCYSGDNTALNYIDHHWGQGGLEIVAKEIAGRLDRFRFEDRFYLDPDQLEMRPITIDMPALIPFWDKIDVGYIKSRMPVASKYKTVEILYKGERINKASSHENSPVLIMGDSFIPHVADTSSGIYAHLAYYTRIIPSAYSRDAGAAVPPDSYKRFVANKGKEPNVVIWEIYGSAFNEVTNLNNWHVISLKDNDNVPLVSQTGVPAGKQGTASAKKPVKDSDRNISWVNGEVIEISELPDIKKLDYPDALYAFKIRITDKQSSGLKTGDTIIVYIQFMKDFKAIKKNVVKKGDRLQFNLEEWTQAAQKTAKIDTMQLVDDLEDFESDIYFCHSLK